MLDHGNDPKKKAKMEILEELMKHMDSLMLKGEGDDELAPEEMSSEVALDEAPKVENLEEEAKEDLAVDAPEVAEEDDAKSGLMKFLKGSHSVPKSPDGVTVSMVGVKKPPMAKVVEKAQMSVAVKRGRGRPKKG